MKNFSGLIKSLNKLLLDNGDIENSQKMEKYFKHSIKAFGLSSPALKSLYKSFKIDHSFQLKDLSYQEKFELSDTLLRSDYFEQKIIGINFLSELTRKLEKNDLYRIRKTFEDGSINNWGICDSICGKVLKPWSILSKENTLEISDWSNEICQNNIVHSERFNQLATGWLLRELSQIDKIRFLNFFYMNFKHFTREGIRYAIEKLPEKERKKLLNYRSDDEEIYSKRKKN